MAQFFQNRWSIASLTIAVIVCGTAVWADSFYATTVPNGSAIDPADVHGLSAPAGHAVVFSRDKDVIDAMNGPDATRQWTPPQSASTDPHPMKTRMRKIKQWFTQKP